MSRFDRFLLRRGGRTMGWLIAAFVAAMALAAGTGSRPRPWWFGSLFALLAASAMLVAWVRWQRERAIRESGLPQFLKRKLRETFPQLDGRDCDLVERGLRQFFLACLRSDRKFVAMPSKAVDAFWHAFILHTRAYDAWCELTLGRFLHHTPAEVLGARAAGNDGLRRAWFWSCREESIDPRKPSRLPLLFALDAKLAIPGGFRYVADCSSILAMGAAGGDASGVYCGTNFADASFAGDAEAMAGVDAADGDSGDGGSSCGGDGGGD
jgi:hypothetical protein